MPTLTFRDTVIDATPGRDVLGQLLDADAGVDYLCMAGSCGVCRVRVEAGEAHLEPMTSAEIHHALPPGSRLACQACTRGTGAVTVSQ